MDTIRLCREIDVEIYSSNVLIYFPGLNISRYAVQHGYIAAEPTIAEMEMRTPNMSQLQTPEKDVLINMDKLFYYFIKYPKLEPWLKRLLKVPPNPIFNILKNIHILRRSLKFDNDQSKFDLIKRYLHNSWQKA